MIRDRHRRGGILVVLLATILGASLAAPAAADGPTGTPTATSSGHVGHHHLVDTVSSPGATCTYATPPAPDWVTQIHMRAPVARARAGRSSQRIGFRYRIQAWDGSAFHDIRTSSIQTRTATPTSDASFTGRSITIHGFQHPEWQAFRVRVDLLWYSGSGAVIGRASMWAHDYTIHWPGSPTGVATDFCGETAG